MPGEDGRYTTKIAIDSTAVQFNFTADTDWENSGTFYLQYETQGEKSYKEDIKLNVRIFSLKMNQVTTFWF